MRLFSRALVALVPAAIAFGGLVGTAQAQPAPGELELHIDLATGGATLVGSAVQPIELSGYQIESASSSLIPANWVTIAPEAGFSTLIAQPNNMSEFSLTGFVLVDDSGRFIGDIFNIVDGSQDLVFTYFNNDNDFFTGNVVYIPIPEPASAGLLLLGGGLALVRRRR